MKRPLFLAIALTLALSGPAHAQVSIETSVSNSRVAVGETFVLDFIVTNADGPVQKPKLPPLDGFTSYSQGHSQEIQIVNGRTSSRSIFSFVLVPNSAGKKTLGPFDITINGRAYKVASVDVEVLPTAPSPSGLVPGGYSYGQGPVASPPARALPDSRVSTQDIFVKAWLDKDEVYVNEPVMLTYTLYTRLSATYKGFEKEPVTTGFWVEDFPPEKTIKRTEQFLNGSRYVVADVRKLALFPTEAGVFTVDPGLLSAVVEVRGEDDFDSFFSSNIFGRRTRFPFASQMIERQIPTEKVTILAKALPEDNKPPGFTGAVGRYEALSSVDKDKLEAGSTFTYRLRVRGEGNISTLELPKPPSPPDFKVYDSATSVNISKERLIVEGEKIVETVMVPKKAGKFTIPPQEFSYFNPVLKRYEIVKTEAHSIQVEPGEVREEGEDAPGAPGVTAADKKEPSLSAKDIRFIKTAAAKKSLLPAGAAAGPFVWAADAALVLAGLFLAFSGLRKQAAVKKDPKRARARGSSAAARRRLKNAADRLHKDNPDGFYGELAKAVYGYFSDRFDLSPHHVNVEVVDRLVGEEAGPALINELKAFLEEVSRGRYGMGRHEKEEMKKLLQRGERLLSAFDKLRSKP